eukprot:m.85232 g.85232  ORF g.85232 m.85232 type:complete len:63 (-) comp14417_c1_seq2:455-643(-)
MRFLLSFFSNQLATVDFGGPLHSVVVIGETDEIEREMLDLYRITEKTPRIERAQGTTDTTLT